MHAHAYLVHDCTLQNLRVAQKKRIHDIKFNEVHEKNLTNGENRRVEKERKWRKNEIVRELNKQRSIQCRTINNTIYLKLPQVRIHIVNFSVYFLLRLFFCAANCVMRKRVCLKQYQRQTLNKWWTKPNCTSSWQKNKTKQRNKSDCMKENGTAAAPAPPANWSCQIS